MLKTMEALAAILCYSLLLHCYSPIALSALSPKLVSLRDFCSRLLFRIGVIMPVSMPQYLFVMLLVA